MSIQRKPKCQRPGHSPPAIVTGPVQLGNGSDGRSSRGGDALRGAQIRVRLDRLSIAVGLGLLGAIAADVARLGAVVADLASRVEGSAVGSGAVA